jgi:hypothetical protein
MRKVIMVLCYNRPEVIEQAIKRLNETQDINGYECFLIDVRYPLPDKNENFKQLAPMALKYGFDFLRPAMNRGVSGNWTWVVNELGLRGNDVLIGMDPDSMPQNNGWCDALTDVLSQGDTPIGYCGLTRVSPPELSTERDESGIGYIIKEVGGRRLRMFSQPMSWPMGGFNAGFVNEVGIHQPRSRYGYIEIATIKEMEKTHWDWGLLDEFFDATSDRGESEYKAWKVDHAIGRTDLDFESYLERINK